MKKRYIVYTMFDFSDTMANEDPDAKVVYLASDVDRLRAEARERVIRELEKTDMKDGAISYHEWAERILAEVFKEASDDSK